MRTLVLLTILTSAAAANAQLVLPRQLNWSTDVAVANGRTSPLAGGAKAMASATAAPTFDRAFYDGDRAGLPYYSEVIALSGNTRSFTAELTEAVFVPLSSEEVKQLPGLGDPGPEPLVVQHLTWYRKQPQAVLSVYPYRRNPGTGQHERLVSLTWRIEQIKTGASLGSQKAYPASSKMASGEWYRFSVAQDGIHQLTYDDLENLGVDVNNLNADAINLYGNHTGLLPFQNNQLPPTDLIQNAIWVQDGGDGQFNPGDRILFYASGPHRWNQDANGNFRHTKNVYSDSASYFLGIGTDLPKRVTDVPLSSDPLTTTVTAFDDRQFIERDIVNLLKSGREYYGETYDLTTSYNYSFGIPFVRSDADMCLVLDVTSRTIGSSNSSSWSIQAGSALNTSFSVQGVVDNYAGMYTRAYRDTFCFQSAQTNLPITVSFSKFDPVSSVGWMNWLELTCRRDLKFFGDQLSFRDKASVGAGSVSAFTLDLAQNVYRVWEITDPTTVGNVPYTDMGAQKSWRIRTDSLRQFIAFRDGGYLTPKLIGRVANQDLHALMPPLDMVIVAHPLFLNEAYTLADRRVSEGLSVQVVTPQQVFNEFSSGTRDATAIKRFMKMLYDRAGSDPQIMPRYLLLFGDGSYNNINLTTNNQNFIPSYQTAVSFDVSKSYTSDDYFGLLDDGEGEGTGDLVDIGIGRLPVHTQQQARDVLNKILNYDRLTLLSSGGQVCSVDGDGGANDWRTMVVFASDDQEGENFEGTIHMSQSDVLATRVENEHPGLNVGKVYLDAYQQYTTPGGERYPDAQEELKNRVQKGMLLLNYIGHGGEVGWAHERFLDNSTILGWTNLERLPLFMTATCEFSRWDDPARTSAGEYVLLNANGGGIALMTTTRIAYSTQNYQLSLFFYDHVFDTEEELGRDMRLGDMFRQTKRDITSAQPTQVNHRNFALLGDPSLRLALPRQRVQITSIEDTLGNPVDTLRALNTVRVRGVVTNGQGQQLTDFNGLVLPTVYDKRVQQSTLANDGGSPFNFTLRKNIIYRGKTSVVDGAFDFTFVMPKDIAYQYGPGRVSVYAESMTTNAFGHSNAPIVGGTSTTALADEQGPRVELYLNDERFVRGGLTNASPILFAKMYDENGINTLGNSIGHDLLAVLDENTDQAIVLNDLYEADLDTYKSGQVRYRFTDLAEGTHTLRIKAWDVYNNSSESSTEFVVAPSEELALAHVLNYPNPFTTYTEFYFEHNRPCSTLDVQVQVFTVSGRLVKTINRRVACEGFRSEPMAWDGLDDTGDKLGRGVYVYRVGVQTPEGDKAEKYEKLVILR